MALITMPLTCPELHLAHRDIRHPSQALPSPAGETAGSLRLPFRRGPLEVARGGDCRAGERKGVVCREKQALCSAYGWRWIERVPGEQSVTQEPRTGQ